MFEDSSYEPIAEIYLTLSGEPSIYCLCSRVFVSGVNENEEIARDLVIEDRVSPELVRSANSEESTVRFCHSSHEYQPLHTSKKSHEEAVSCYCSASHYSTDEHDSLRDVSVSHHSDSGADLSESSRDLDWERFWTINGERLIWESWILKYGSYIDPVYLSNGATTDVTVTTAHPADGEETLFCVESNKFPNPDLKTSFSGLLENARPESENCRSSISEEKLEENNPPQILVDIVQSEVHLRRLSDFSDTCKSVSGKSEDSLNLDENGLRLGVNSICSGSSAMLSATTDSMTNITRMTLSSSDSSCGVDDSSVKSSSVLSSSDSTNSADQQWQLLWAEHFNEQYYFHYNKFTDKLAKKRDGDEVRSDSGFIIEECKVTSGQLCATQRQESVDEVGSIETQDSVSQESDQSATDGSKPICKRNSSKKKLSHRQRLSVGYLLQQLKTMSVEPTEKIREEDEFTKSVLRPSTTAVEREGTSNKLGEEQGSKLVVNSVPRPSTSVNMTEAVNGKVENEPGSNVVLNVNSDQVQDTEYFSVSNDSILQESGDVEQFNDQMNNVVSVCNEETEPCDDSVMKRDSVENKESSKRHGTKRSHEQESEEFESNVEKMKSAYQLMGLMFDLKDTKKIRKASVCYKKRFSQIRFQNRILRLPKPPNKHIYFDDDDEPKMEDPTSSAIGDGNETEERFEDASDKTTLHEERRKLEMEDFSEKDDSTEDEQDIFFSAEEDNLDDSQERKLKNVPKRRKKRQMKKKFISYPQEMVDNPIIKKFWRRRYSLFSKYDEGIKMDAESWYSVTPEKIAINVAKRCQSDVIVDAFCGAGGNAIQLAFTCERVIAIDIDPHKIELARHNARVYGVEDRIEFIVADFLQLAPTLSADAVFLSPPWGGPGYSRRNVFPLASLLPVSGQELFRLTSQITDNIAFYLPKNINTQELVECAGPGGCVEVVQNFLDRELIALTAYFGELVNPTV